MADIATFLVSGNGDAELVDSPVDFFISKKGGVHEMIVEGGPIVNSLITPFLAIPGLGRTFVPVLDNNSPLIVQKGARPFHAFLVGLQLKFITENYDGNPVTITLWL